jgi:hypothetical protein
MKNDLGETLLNSACRSPRCRVHALWSLEELLDEVDPLFAGIRDQRAIEMPFYRWENARAANNPEG